MSMGYIEKERKNMLATCFHRPYAIILAPLADKAFGILYGAREKIRHFPAENPKVEMLSTFRCIANYFAVYDKVIFLFYLNDANIIERDLVGRSTLLDAIYYLDPEKIVKIANESEKMFQNKERKKEVFVRLIRNAIDDAKEKNIIWHKPEAIYGDFGEDITPPLPDIITPIANEKMFVDTFYTLLLNYHSSWLRETANSYVEELASIALDLPILNDGSGWPKVDKILSVGFGLTVEEFVGRCREEEKTAVANGGYKPFKHVSAQTVFNIWESEHDRSLSGKWDQTVNFFKLINKYGCPKMEIMWSKFSSISEENQIKVIKQIYHLIKQNKISPGFRIRYWEKEIKNAIKTKERNDFHDIISRYVCNSDPEIAMQIYSMMD